MEMGLLDHVEQRGMELGVLKGQRELVREQLESRFGPLSATAVACLEAWPGERLRELGRALVLADSLVELGLAAAEPGDAG